MSESDTRIAVNMSFELEEQVRTAAHKNQMGMSSFIKMVLNEYFNQEDSDDDGTVCSCMSVDLNESKESDKGWLKKLLKL